jgi:hypothetical protein
MTTAIPDRLAACGNTSAILSNKSDPALRRFTAAEFTSSPDRTQFNTYQPNFRGQGDQSVLPQFDFLYSGRAAETPPVRDRGLPSAENLLNAKALG